jgi:murein L,D-transpeptidase YafK
MRWLALLLIASCTSPRVERARDELGPVLERRFERAGVAFPPRRAHLRVFKQERSVELWASDAERGAMRLIHRYRACGMSGTVGPKRSRGDRQVPEGFYEIDRFNARSRHVLSLGLSYPNEADRGTDPGGDIFIHGGCTSAGCIAVGDRATQELYLAVLAAREAGQTEIPVHVFPARLTRRNLARLSRAHPEHRTFWRSLAPAYRHFERVHEPAEVFVDARGRYVVEDRAQVARGEAGPIRARGRRLLFP